MICKLKLKQFYVKFKKIYEQFLAQKKSQYRKQMYLIYLYIYLIYSIV